MSRRLGVAVIAIAASLTLAGCSGPSSPGNATVQTSAAQAPAAEPASGATVSGTGYSYVVPEGWNEPGDEVSSGADSLAADLTDADGFADNVNVVLSPAGEVTADQVESQGVDELQGAGATDVTVRDRLTVAGSESAHLSAGFSSNGVDYQIEQYYLTHDGQTYVVTFSFSKTVSQTDRDDLAASVLQTWSWA